MILADRIVGGEEDDELEESERTATLHFCRYCGAAHREAGDRCLHCGKIGDRVALFAIKQKEDNPGFLPICVPLIPLEVAAGSSGKPQQIDESDYAWVEVDTRRTLRKGMFVAQVVGKSMEPRIPDGSYCLFTDQVAGSRENRTLVIGLRDELDPETGERFTVKRYQSEKVSSDDGAWRHLRVTLLPANPAYDPLELTIDDERQVHVVAELLEVLT